MVLRLLVRCLVHVVYLRYFEEVVHEERGRPHTPLWQELTLVNVSAIELELKLFALKVLLYQLHIFQIAKTKMVDLVREIKLVPTKHQALCRLRIVVHANVEVTRHLVDVDEA